MIDYRKRLEAQKENRPTLEEMLNVFLVGLGSFWVIVMLGGVLAIAFDIATR